MIAFLFNTGWTELLLVVLISVMVFGRDLPQVAAKAFVQLQKLRRGVSEVWRETGISDEMRKLQREMEENDRRARAPFQEARRIQAELKRDVRRAGGAPDEDAPPIGAPVPGTVSVGSGAEDDEAAELDDPAGDVDAATGDADDSARPTPGGEPERREDDER